MAAAAKARARAKEDLAEVVAGAACNIRAAALDAKDPRYRLQSYYNKPLYVISVANQGQSQCEHWHCSAAESQSTGVSVQQ